MLSLMSNSRLSSNTTSFFHRIGLHLIADKPARTGDTQNEVLDESGPSICVKKKTVPVVSVYKKYAGEVQKHLSKKEKEERALCLSARNTWRKDIQRNDDAYVRESSFEKHIVTC